MSEITRSRCATFNINPGTILMVQVGESSAFYAVALSKEQGSAGPNKHLTVALVYSNGATGHQPMQGIMSFDPFDITVGSLFPCPEPKYLPAEKLWALMKISEVVAHSHKDELLLFSRLPVKKP